MFSRTPATIHARPLGSRAELDVGPKGEKSFRHPPPSRSMLTQIPVPLPSEMGADDIEEGVVDGFGSLNTALETIYADYEVRL